MMVSSSPLRPSLLLLAAVPVVLGARITPPPPEANPYTEALLKTVRALAHSVPGELPTSIGCLSVQDDSSALSDAVADAPHTKVYQVTPVFQIRYHAGWVMVDAAYTKEMAGNSGTFFPDRYEQIVAALRGARLIVITHEHNDHVGTLTVPVVAKDVAPKTLLTKQQEQTMLYKPKLTGAKLDAAAARRFLIVDYPRVLPIAPGVVLIRADGHTPGSQMVYVKLASGREVVLVGDVVWHMTGIDEQRQKPDSASLQMREDRTTIDQQIRWLKTVVAPAGITPVVSHDGTEIQSLVKQGILTDGLDVSAP